MLYTYAIEPDALVTWDKCRHLLDLMGFQHGRAIAAYPTRKRWKALVRAACRANANLRDRDLKRILTKLDRSNMKIIRSDGTTAYDDMLAPAEKRWIRNAVAHQTTAGRFHAILATRNPDDHPDVVLEEDVDASHSKLNISREVLVLREPAATAAHVDTLVRNSCELLLIDPHFDPSKRKWRSVMKACINLAAQTEHEFHKIAIHTRDDDGKPSREEFRNRCGKHIPVMMSGKVTLIHVYRWRIRDEDLHARYLLTDRGGYKLDKGLDAERGVKQPVGLLDEQFWEQLRKIYSDASRSLDRDDAFTVEKSGELTPLV